MQAKLPGKVSMLRAMYNRSFWLKVIWYFLSFLGGMLSKSLRSIAQLIAF